jgi:hypothetical protein
MSIFTRLVKLFRGPKSKASARQEGLRQRLRIITLHDEAKIDRLIAFERDELKRKRLPESTVEGLMERALGRWERDNR